MQNSNADRDIKKPSRKKLVIWSVVEGAKNWNYRTQYSKGLLSHCRKEKCDV